MNKDFDYLTVHIIETTASCTPYRNTSWAATVRYIVSQRQSNLSWHLLVLSIKAMRSERAAAFRQTVSRK